MHEGSRPLGKQSTVSKCSHFRQGNTRRSKRVVSDLKKNKAQLRVGKRQGSAVLDKEGLLSVMSGT